MNYCYNCCYKISILMMDKNTGETSKGNDKKRQPLSLEDRVKILERLSAGERQVDIASKLHISPSTISSINRRRETILNTKNALELRGGNLKVKKCKKSNFANKEDDLYDWFIQQRDAGLPVKGFHLQEKALQLNEEEHDKNLKFKASNGWLHRFKKRKGIRMVADEKKKRSLDTIANEKLKLEFNTFITLANTTPDLVYNCDEIELDWKQLPKKTIGRENKKSVTGGKQTKNRITVMMCTNASGSHKIPLYVIGSANQSRCFRGVKQLPVHYGNQQKAKMSQELMLKWYKYIFLPAVQKKHGCDYNPNVKVVLIMDNASFHPPVQEFSSISEICTVVFLPVSETSLVQPLHQGIVTSMKMDYRKLFLSHVYARSVINGIEASLKSFTLLDAVKCCAKVWDDVSPDIIQKCWKNFKPIDNAINLLEDNIDVDSFHSFITKLPEFFSYSKKDTLEYLNCEDLSDESELEVVCKAECISSDNDMIEDSNDDAEFSSEISIYKGLDALTNFIKYYEKDEDCSKSTLKLLQTLNLSMVEKIIAEKYT